MIDSVMHWTLSANITGMSVFEIMSVAISTLSFLVSAIVLILLAWQVKLLSLQVKDARRAIEFSTIQSEADSLRRSQQATMNFMSETLTKLQELSNQIPAAGSADQADFLERAMSRDSSEFFAVRDYLNYLEDLATGFNMKIFDRAVVARLSAGRLRRAWQYYNPWILAERETLTAGVFEELEACVALLAANADDTGLGDG